MKARSPAAVRPPPWVRRGVGTRCADWLITQCSAKDVCGGRRAAERRKRRPRVVRGSLPIPEETDQDKETKEKSSSRRVVPGVTSTRRARKEKPEITVVSRDDRRHRCGRAEKTQSTERQGEVGTSGCRSRSLATVCVSLFWAEDKICFAGSAVPGVFFSLAQDVLIFRPIGYPNETKGKQDDTLPQHPSSPFPHHRGRH